MKDYSQQAAFHRAALLLGLTTGDRVVRWADSVIMHDHDAPGGFMQLSLVPAEDLSELRHALFPLAARDESPLIIPALFDRVRADLIDGKRNVKDSLTVLQQARSLLKVPAAPAEELISLFNAHMLATAQVTGDIPEIEARVRTWLEQFAGGESAFHQKYP